MRKNLRVLSITATICGLLTMASTAWGADVVKSDMKVNVNGKPSDLASVSQLVDSSLYAPYESVAKSLNVEAKWDAGTRTMILKKDVNVMELAADAAEVKLNGVKVTTATPLQVLSGKPFLPVRLVSEVFGNTIGYEDKSRTVSVSIPDKPGFRLFGIGDRQALAGSELSVTAITYNHLLKDFAQNKDPKAGEGHVHLWLDTETTPQAAVKSFKGESVVFKDIPPGEHTLTVQLVGNDHKPIQPEVKQVVKFQSAKVSILADLDPEKATGMRIEGVTGDAKGQLYTVDSDSRKLFRISSQNGKVEELTVLSRAATGMVFDKAGNLYMASGSGTDGGAILRVLAKDLEGGSFDASVVETFVTGVTGANGMTFDEKGNLYVSGGANGNVYIVSPEGSLINTWGSGLVAERTDQRITVNGLAFGQDRKLYIANTSSGEISRVALNADGSFGKPELFVRDALLYGADGIAFGTDGTLYVCANERNAIVKVTPDGKVMEVASNGNAGLLEFPASVHVIGDTLYISNFDVQRGVNNPNTPGIGASIAQVVLKEKK
ncbi:SMP-30/gluconolactonase/LRE family protein [Paenibacillus sp. HJGM_3]|uniref:SMP-30/gluconolactonase/LRE family protein n=1 Tax=Paenibacillus sp. HJGM_3 TaxID=3379816 RepID=UPI00385C4474